MNNEKLSPSAHPARASDHQPSTINYQLAPPSGSALRSIPGETLRAFSAFMTYYQLGHARSLPALATHLGERRQTLKNWSSKYHWRERINAYNSSHLEAQARAEVEAQRLQAADWARRALALRLAPRPVRHDFRGEPEIQMGSAKAGPMETQN